MGSVSQQVAVDEWVSFPGGELEGLRPRVSARHAATNRSARQRRAFLSSSGRSASSVIAPSLDRERALKAAGELDTASSERFQSALPFEPVNRARLAMLEVERAKSRETAHAAAGAFTDRRHQAQIKARHALQRILSGISSCPDCVCRFVGTCDCCRNSRRQSAAAGGVASICDVAIEAFPHAILLPHRASVVTFSVASVLDRHRCRRAAWLARGSSCADASAQRTGTGTGRPCRAAEGIRRCRCEAARNVPGAQRRSVEDEQRGISRPGRNAPARRAYRSRQ